MSRERARTGPPDISNMHTLKIDNISRSTTIELLKDAFSSFGEIGDVYIPRIHGTMDPRGFAFVRFVDLRDAEDAVKGMDSKELDGREIRVAIATNKRPDKRDRYDDRRGGRDDDRRGGGYGRDRDRDYRRRSPSPARRGRDRSGSRSRERYGRDRDRDDRRDGARDRDFRRSRSPVVRGGSDRKRRSRS